MSSVSSPRILVIRRRYLGDLVLLGPLFRNLRLHWPEAHLVSLSEAAYAPILTINPDVNRVMILPKKLSLWPAFVRELRRVGFTHVIDIDAVERTALVSRLVGARETVAYSHKPVPLYRRWAYRHVVTLPGDRYSEQSISDTCLALLEPLRVPVQTRDLRLTPRPADLEAAAQRVGPAKRKLLIHPGSRSAFRVWPAERFAAVADRLQDEHDVQVFIAAGPGERDVAQAIQQRAQSHVVVLDSTLPVTQFAALLAQFPVVLCHDSGPMHIASAVGCKVVALYSSQNTTIWRPLGEGHTVLQTTLPCSCLPASERPGPCDPGDSYRSYCVRKLDVDTVYAAVAAKLGVAATRPGA